MLLLQFKQFILINHSILNMNEGTVARMAVINSDRSNANVLQGANKNKAPHTGS